MLATRTKFRFTSQESEGVRSWVTGLDFRALLQKCVPKGKNVPLHAGMGVQFKMEEKGFWWKQAL